MSTQDLKLRRDSAGHLLLDHEGGEHKVVPVRAYPISAPDEGLSLLDSDGHELRWIDRLGDLPDAARALLEDELARREFMPEIRCIHSVSTFATPSRWQVGTDRGETELLLKSEDHIRRLGARMLLITDGHGVSFLLRDIGALDPHSRRLLDRFL